MIAILRGAAALLLLLKATEGFTQTVEQSYADQCAKGETSEICTVLREALLKKLGAATKLTTSIDPGAGVRTSSPDQAQRERWGAFALLADEGTWVGTMIFPSSGPGVSFESYDWVDEDTIRTSTRLVTLDGKLWSEPAKTIEVHLSPDNTLSWTDAGKTVGPMPVHKVNSTMRRTVDSGVYEYEKTFDGNRIVTKAYIIEGNKRELTYTHVQEPAAGRTWAGMRDEIVAQQQANAAAKRNGDGPNVLMGFLKGFSEATAANHAMEQSMENAIDRGIAQGAAEYARRQDYVEVDVLPGTDGGMSAESNDAAIAPPPGEGAQSSADSQPKGETLRYVLMVPLREPIKGKNAYCFSNIITVPNVQGWRIRSFDGTTRYAREIIETRKADFTDRCRAVAALSSDVVEVAWNEPGEEGDPDEVFNRFSSYGFPQVDVP